MICTFRHVDGTYQQIEIGGRPFPDTYQIPEMVGVATHWDPTRPKPEPAFRCRVYDRRRRQGDGAIVYVERA